jgi:FkbM family methyltransferase
VPSVKRYVKPAWKAIMRGTLKLYAQHPSLWVYNDRKLLDPADLRAIYGPGALPEDGNAEFYSQYGQDYYVLHKVFAGRRSGIFVDIGGNHPIECSNSYLLERHGWTGLAVEPQRALNALWPLHRKTPCLDCVVGPEPGEVVFVEAGPEAHGLSGVEGYNKVQDAAQRRVVPQRRLDAILLEHGIHRVDYLSIDVEGYELEVLRSLDLERIDVRLIGLENDTGFRHLPVLGKRLGRELGNNTIRSYLRQRGYTQVARIVSDDFFLKTG